MALACACDLRYAARSAVFATAFLRVGVSGDYGAVWTVTRAVGPAKARELFLLGDRVAADEAARIGLVHGVVADHDLDDHVSGVATRLAASAPIAVAGLKANLNDALILGFSAYLDREAERFGRCLHTEDAREAARAFLEKRTPTFRGR